MKPSLLLCIFVSITAIAAAPANEAPPDSIPLRRSASVQSATTSTSNNPQPSDAGAILYPAIYDTNLTDVHNLDPQLALQVYYEEPGNGSNAAIVAFEDLKHPTVVLEHSSYITNVTCSNGKVNIQFSSRSMASYAFDSWNANISSGIIFVTNHPTCADSYPAERGWILISTVDKNGASITCAYVDVMVQDIIKTVGIYFGQNTIPSSSSAVPGVSSHSSSLTSSGSKTSVNPSKTSTTSHSNTSTTRSSSSTSRTSTSHSSYSSASISKSTVASQSKPTSSSSTSKPTSTSSSTHSSSSIFSSTKPTSTSSSTHSSSSTSSLKPTSSSTHSVSQSHSSTSSSTSLTRSTSSSLRSSTVTSSSTLKSSTTSTKSQISSTSSSTSTLHSTSTTSHPLSLTSTLSRASASRSSSSSVSSRSASVSSTLHSTTSSTQSSSLSLSSVRSTSSKLSSSTFPQSKSSTSSLTVFVTTTSSPVYSSTSSSSSIFKLSSSSSSSKSASLSSTLHSTSSSSSTFKSLSSSSSSKSASLSSTPHSTTQSSSTQVSTSSNSVASTSGPLASATSQPFITIADFDTALDDSLGYMNSSGPTFWDQLLPGIPFSQMGGFGTPPSLLRRQLARRDWNLVSIAAVLTENLPTSVGLALSIVQTEFQTASTAIDAAVSVAIGVVIESLNALSPFTLGPFPFSAGPNNNVTTDFGAGIQLTSTSGTYNGASGTVTTYCIECGVTGTFSVVGTILFDAEEGITQAVFDLTGSIHAQIELAVVATASASASDEKNLITQGLPDLTVPGFLVLGPTIALDVGATVSVEALGGLAAGYALDWPAITAHFDILNDDYSANGLLPTGTPIADTELDIKSTATLYALVTLSFGIDVMSGKYKANVGLVDKPEIDAFTEVVVYTDPQIATMDDGTVICVGENFTLGITDSAYADVVWGGVGKKPISTKTYPLTTWAGPTFTTCFGSLSTIHHTSTTSSTASSTTPSPMPSPTPTVFTGPCDPAPEADGYCCPLPPAWVVGPAFTYWSDCINTSLEQWTLAVDKECGTNKTCFDNIYDPLNVEHTQDCGTDTQTYEYGVCTYDNFWLIEKILSIQYAATWGKREVKDRNKRWLEATRTVLEKRQAGFVNVIGHGTRNSTTMLAWTQDGNLVASQNGTLFATLGGNVIGDTNGRFLHYYELWMGEAEVSRLRLADLDMMPVGSVLVSLAPMDITGLASPALVAFTSSGAYYYLITCTITGQLPKLFLTSDISLGIEELLAPGVQDTLTGGVVEECGLLPWSI